MRPPAIILISALALLSAAGGPPKTDSLPSPESARAAATDALLNERQSPEAFDRAVAQARKAGVPPQTIAEARFLFHVDRNENRAIAAMVPELLKLRDSFNEKDTIAFAVRNDWLAVIEYAQALAALEKNDKPAFKSHITEAFWLCPAQGPAFTPHIERFHLKEAMRGLKIDPSTVLNPADRDGKPSSLADLATGGKALLLHFWSPDSAECVDSLADFNASAAVLSEAGIKVVSVTPPPPTAGLTEQPSAGTIPKSGPDARWMRETPEKKLSSALRVKTLPTFVLLSADGSVLFNGSPSDPEFWNTATSLAPSVKRPQSPVREPAGTEK